MADSQKTDDRRRDLKWRLTIEESRRQDALVLALAGRIDHRTAEDLRTRLDRAILGGDRRVVIDLASVDYLSSPGVQVIDAANTRLRALKGAIVVCGLAEPVRLVLDLAGTIGRLAIETSTDRAIGRLALEFLP